MKKVFLLLMVLSLVIAAPAFAETWGGEEWIKHIGGGGDLVQDGNILHYVDSGTQPGESHGAYVAQNISEDFTKDFQYALGFHIAYNTPTQYSRGLDFGFMQIVDGAPGFTAYVSVFDDGGFNKIGVFVEDGDMEYVNEQYDRPISDGYVGVRYNAELDVLGIGVMDLKGNMIDGEEFDNVRNSPIFPGAMNLFMTGWSEGVEIGQGESFFFKADNIPSPVPEPISSALFLLGGSAMAGIRFMKKIRKHKFSQISYRKRRVDQIRRFLF